ncbi:DnaT-like ssDNA-binding protein [Caulobacter segnis]|uniref:Putative DnaT-like domain-containing protein n=1 Tax=Caulobacter segnis TaxID=88688 RepID=A0A2W5VIG4_9CAUL|nr:DnaT-like ssDNA-binding protein [Caulobacter segnis]PZR36486.1 MAG: hypothetical protein DI526_03355 [Caulobacter segnis]
MAGYGSDNGFGQWLADNGLTLPGDAPAPAALRQRGSAHVDEHEFPGSPTSGFAQERAWPRTGATANCQAIPSDVIPVAIVNAAYAAAYHEALNPGSLSGATNRDPHVKRERFRVEGAVDKETEYFSTGDAAADAKIVIPAVEGLLAPFVLEEPAVALGVMALG